MIQANELRIGNLVRLFLGVDDNGPKYREYKIEGIKIEHVSSRYFVDNMWIEISNNLEPIPLTEDWLIKMGAVKSKSYKEEYYLNGINYNIKDKVCFIYFGDSEIEYFNHIHTVHQMQNFYFALTNEELTINP